MENDQRIKNNYQQNDYGKIILPQLFSFKFFVKQLSRIMEK